MYLWTLILNQTFFNADLIQHRLSLVFGFRKCFISSSSSSWCSCCSLPDHIVLAMNFIIIWQMIKGSLSPAFILHGFGWCTICNFWPLYQFSVNWTVMLASQEGPSLSRLHISPVSLTACQGFFSTVMHFGLSMLLVLAELSVAACREVLEAKASSERATVGSFFFFWVDLTAPDKKSR